MAHKSHYDPAKEKWREAWLQFIRKHKHHLRGKPRDWQVVFFPGEEALEVKVYDELRIPRENLLGLERDPKVYEKLRKRKLGIRLTDEPIDAKDFFEQTDGRFDIVNLDYEGTLNPTVVDTLEFLAGRQLLTEGSLFSINILNQREGESTQEFYRKIIAARELYALIKRGDKSVFQNQNPSSRSFIEHFGHHDDQMIKHLGHTDGIIGVFLAGTQNVEINLVFKRNPGFDSIDSIIDEASKQKGIEINHTPIHATDLYYNVHISALTQYLLRKGFIDWSSAQLVAMLACDFQARPYIPVVLKKYQYQSNNSLTMVSDFFAFSQYRFQYELFRYVAEHAYLNFTTEDFVRSMFPGTLLSRISDGAIKSSIMKAADIIAHNRVDSKVIEGPREFLGSSASLPKLDGPTYYQERCADIQKGIPKEETRERLLREFKVKKGPKQLNAFEYWFSQGKYGPIEPTNNGSMSKPLEVIIAPDKFELTPHQYWNRLPEQFKQRIRFFIEDDLRVAGLDSDQTRRLTGEVRASKWYKTLNGYQLSDSQFYAFFDDILLELVDGRIPDRRKVAEIFTGILQPNWREKGILRDKPILTLQEYERLSFYEERDDAWISDHYSTPKPNSIRAFKAWVTMKHGKKTEKEDLGLKVASMIRSGKQKPQIMEELGITDYQYRGFLRAYRGGSYNRLLRDKEGTVMPRIYIDSHGVVHVNPRNRIDTEKGYK